MKIILKNIAVMVSAIAATLAVCLGILAWTEPGATPPNGNVAAPINTGSNAQSKAGDLSIGSGLKYWITKEGDSFALKNNAGTNQLKVGQDGNVVASVKVSTPSMCLGSDCRTSWPAASAQSCPAGQTVTGIAADGKIICGSSNPYPPITASLPAGSKRIFVGGGFTYPDWRKGSGWWYSRQNIGCSTVGDGPSYCHFDDEAGADVICQKMAESISIPGTYKALIHITTRNPRSVLTPGNSFYNPEAIKVADVYEDEIGNAIRAAGTGMPSIYGVTSGICYYNLVANSADDFFTDNGDGNYLQRPIFFGESGGGSPLGGQRVMTGFKADGSNGNINSDIGRSDKKNSLWATGGQDYVNTSGYYNTFYCVEQ